MSNDLTLVEAIAKMREVIAKVPGEKWVRSEVEDDGPPQSMTDLVESVANCYRAAPESLVVHGVYIPDGEGFWACHTGNGPHGAAMAEFSAHARNWMPLFLDHLEALMANAPPTTPEEPSR